MTSPWRAHVLTLFPEMFPGPLAVSLAGKAREEEKWDLNVYNIRDHAPDRHKTVDDSPFGGGPGMVMRPDIVHACITHVCQQQQRPPLMVYLTPRGRPLQQDMLRRFAHPPGELVILCGHYEGIDQRVIDAWNFEEVSIGDYVLSGGEMAALVLLDGIIRLLPGVVGEPASLTEESFSQPLLEYPHFTRPQEWAFGKVPDVLLSGHHQKISDWRQQQAESITAERRPDLWQRYNEKGHNFTPEEIQRAGQKSE